MNILVVDDDISQIKILKDAIELFNSKSAIKISLDEATTLDDGLQKLQTRKVYDGAIVDLRLEKNDKVGLGNQILKEIINKLRFPVRVLTAHTGDLDPEFQIENSLFKCKGRGEEDYDCILSDFFEIYSTGITGILNHTGKIETNINSIFWNHIAEVLPEFVSYKSKNQTWDAEKVLLRYISSHILEYLEISIDNNLEPVHHIEFYIKPPIKDKIFTGDIIELKEKKSFGVVLTPACDLATDTKRIKPKAEFVTIAIIEKLDEVLSGKNTGEVQKLKSNNLDLKFHYLPETILFAGGFINFQNLLSIPVNEIYEKEKYKIECVITNPFRKDIVSRFANYFSRQGQPFFPTN